MYTQREIEALDDKVYRESYLEDQVKSYIAYQIKSIRENLGLTQVEFAGKIGKPQSVVSRLENLNYGRMKLQTLLELAAILDVALVVKFASYSDFLRSYDDVSLPALHVKSYEEEKSIVKTGDFVCLNVNSDGDLEKNLSVSNAEDCTTAIGFGETSYVVSSMVVGSQISLVSGVAITPFFGASLNVSFGLKSHE